jgi:hypothetical protein
VPREASCDEAVRALRRPCSRHLRPQDKALRSLQGGFVGQVFDQGESGSSGEEITGDSSPSNSSGRRQGLHPGGYIEGGTVQVES